MAKQKECSGIAHITYSNNKKYDVDWYICHYCHRTFIYDYGMAKRYDPNFCPICGAPNKPIRLNVLS